MRIRSPSPTRTTIKGHAVPYIASPGNRDRVNAMARLGPGVMLRGDAGAIAAADLRLKKYEGPLILDPARYEKAHTQEVQPSLLGVFHRWLDPQLTHNVNALVAPSIGIQADQMELIPRVLGDGAAFAVEAGAQADSREVVVPINVYGRWLTNHLEGLTEMLEASGHVVGIVLTDSTDPLNRVGGVAALAQLVEALPRCVVVRTDIAGLGALAWGAQWVAIGTSSTTRHAAKPGGRGHSFALDDRTPSVLVEQLLGYRRASKLEQLERVGDVLGCRCAVCGGNDLRRFADPKYLLEAQSHNAAVVTRLAADLDSAQDRRHEWITWCKRALEAHAWVRETTGVAVYPPLPLKEWAHLR